MSADTYIGALTLPTQPGILLDQVNDAVAKGAKVLVGGKVQKRPGNWFEPTVLVNVNHSMSMLSW
jgi:acyl-CoA reductase-like NAD-dependent aldehyde dehydrogenase